MGKGVGSRFESASPGPCKGAHRLSRRRTQRRFSRLPQKKIRPCSACRLILRAIPRSGRAGCVQRAMGLHALTDDYIQAMCGESYPEQRATSVMNVRDSRVHNYPPRWNGAPSQELLVIRRNHKTGEISLDPLRWGLIPYWCKDPVGGRKPINANYETVRDLPTFRDAYRKRRCIVPVDGFFESRAIKGRSEGKAALRYRYEGWRVVRHCRHLGELEGTGFRRMDSDLC